MTMARGGGVLVAAIALAGTLTAGSGPLSQEQDAATAAIVERGGRYVEAYQQEFSAVVSEELQIQKLVRVDGTVRQTRELKSDFLLVKTGPVVTQAFRDVIEVDGKPVRNREDRLRKLFLDSPKTAVDQARAIAMESARHNIGVRRIGNSPLLPLIVLEPRHASGFRFAKAGGSVTFEEFRSPSVLGGQRNGTRYDLMSRGSFEIEADSGRVLAAEITAIGPAPSAAIRLAVRYAEDPKLKLMVPVDVVERYWSPHKPKDDRLEVTCTYTNFRRFQVTYGEQIKVP
jgi:hypothetical protein